MNVDKRLEFIEAEMCVSPPRSNNPTDTPQKPDRSPTQKHPRQAGKEETGDHAAPIADARGRSRIEHVAPSDINWGKGEEVKRCNIQKRSTFIYILSQPN